MTTVGHKLSASGYPVVPARYAVRCSMCRERVEAKVETTGRASTHHVLPVDREGRCASCVLLLCEYCDGREGGCKRCEWTGVTS